MPFVYIGQYVWDTTIPNLPSWSPPLKNQCIGSIDLRSLPSQSIAGGSPQGFGVFVYPSTVSDPNLRFIGDSLTSSLSKPIKNLIETRLGFAQNSITKSLLNDVLFELFTSLADVSGSTRWKPLIPTIQGDLELHLGGFSIIKSEKFNVVEHPFVFDVVKNDWLNLITTPIQKRKVLGAIMKKYKISNEELFNIWKIPFVEALEPTTLISDNFNRADNADMSVGAPFSWTDVDGDWQILTNQAELVTAGGTARSARAESDLSTSDHSAYVDVTDLGTPTTDAAMVGGASCRFAGAEETLYTGHLYQFPAGSDSARTQKIEAGTGTTIGVETNITWATTDNVKIEANGSTITRYYNGASQDVVTDTSITGNTRTGLNGFRNATEDGKIRLDNFEATDLVVSAFFQHSGPLRIYRKNRR